tara:strand:- start:1230 stop:1532 length:303 start_codon:yes stop_codon:yes gene_type:complete
VELPLEILIALGGGGASVIVAWGIAQQKLTSISSALLDIEKRLRALDNRVDKTEGATELLQNKLTVLASMSSPESLERKNREIASILKDIEFLRKQWGAK